MKKSVPICALAWTGWKSKQGEIEKCLTTAYAFTALEHVTGVAMVLQNFELHSASIGEDAIGGAIAAGARTVDVAADGEPCVSTTAMTDEIIRCLS